MSTNGVHHTADEDIDTLYSFWPGTAPAPAPCPEAVFSLTLRGKMAGQDAMLTIRGQSPDEFRRNLDAVRGLLDPVQAPAPPAPQGEGWCAKHGLQMQRTEKAGRSWFSHRVDGRWCKGR